MTTKVIGIGGSQNGSLIYGEGGIRSGTPILGDTTLPSIPFKMAKSSIKNITGEIGTFVRATPATVKDHENVIREALSGEMRFQGQRRVENLVIGSSEDFEDAAWTLNLATLTSGISDPNGGTGAFTLKATSSNGSVYNAVTVAANTAIVNSVYIKRRVGLGVIQIHDGTAYQAITITNEWVRYSIAAGTADTSVFNAIQVITSGDEIDIYAAQLQDKTGASDPTIPDGYVSTGVLSSPYHGANVDGVAYFKSTNGNSVVSNIVTHAAGTLITDDIGYLGEITSTNKCTNYNANPDVGITNTNKTGDAAATLTRVADVSELASAGLDNICTDGNVFKLDNSGGASNAHVEITGTTTNTNAHSLSVQGRVSTGTGRISDNAGDGAVQFTNTTYDRILSENYTPAATTRYMIVTAFAGAVVYFILNQLEEQAFSTSEIIVAGSAVTRNKDELSYPTTNIPVNDCVFSFDWTPTAENQGTIVLISSGSEANNRFNLVVDGTGFTFHKRDSSVSRTSTYATSYLANVPLSVKFRVDSVNGMDIWIENDKGVNNTLTSDLSIGSSIIIGGEFDGTFKQTGGIDNFTIHKGSFTDAEVVAI